MDGLEVLHDVQLAHVLKVPVEGLDEGVDELQDGQLVLVVRADDEEERGVPSVHDALLVVRPGELEEGALVVLPREALPHDLRLLRSALLHCAALHAIEVVREPRLPVLVHHQEELDHRRLARTAAARGG
eukprot:SAG31_NODE_499_length_14841_cov_7.930471_5_plen_130_part_00